MRAGPGSASAARTSDVLASDIGGAEESHDSPRFEIPLQGRPWHELRAELLSRKKNDYDWRAGRVPIYIYHDDDELLAVSREAYALYFTENALGRRAFPSLAKMEQEVVAMSLALFKAPPGAAGSFTSGGTESIFLALKTARDSFRRTHTRSRRPNIVVPKTAHPAFDKAAHYLDVDVVRTGVRADLRADVGEIAGAVNENTMLIAGSAPCYPYGVFDPIADLAAVARSRSLWLHVDACLGGFLAPFVRKEGVPIPEFDFGIDGVTTLSADLHKYGFSARGASVLLYREAARKADQVFQFDNWPRGNYATETFAGSRPGGAIASAWAVAQFLGEQGYRRLARKTMDAKERLVRGIECIAGLEVLRPSELSIVLYRSTDSRLDIHAVAEGLLERGWFVGRSREPEAIHLALNAVHAPIIEDYVADLQAAAHEARTFRRVGRFDASTY